MPPPDRRPARRRTGRRPAAQHRAHMGPGSLEALVPGEPRAVRLPGQPYGGDVRVQVADRCQRGEPHLGGHLAPPAVLLQARAEALLRALGPGGRLDAGGQAPVLVPAGDTPECLAERRPGSPSGSTELARRVNPPAARSRHSPRSSLSTGCQARAVTRASSPKEAAGPRRRAGAGGTTLPATSADSAMRMVSPLFVVTDSTPSSHDVRTPTVSVNFAPSPGTSATRRTDTRLPTSAGVMRTSSRPPMVNSTALSAPPVRIVPRNGDTRGGHRRRRAPAREPTPYRGGTTA